MSGFYEYLFHMEQGTWAAAPFTVYRIENND